MRLVKIRIRLFGIVNFASRLELTGWTKARGILRLDVAFVELIVLLAALVMSGGALAMGQQQGTVLEVRVSTLSLSVNPTHVLLSGNALNRPACATQPWWAIDTDTTYGKNLLAAIMVAQASGKIVTIFGKAVCDLRSDMETVFQISITG